MSTAGAPAEVLPLVTYLENPEQIVVDKNALGIHFIVHNSFQDVRELTIRLLRATASQTPLSQQDDIQAFFLAHQQECVEKAPRLTRLLSHTFNMRCVEHESIRAYLQQIHIKIRAANNKQALNLAELYQQQNQTYRELCYLGLHKANIWYALLQHLMPHLQSVHQTTEEEDVKKAVLQLRTHFVVNLCAETFDPCVNLMQRMMAGEAGADTFKDYGVVIEKLSWMTTLLPEYVTYFLNDLKVPFLENTNARLLRIKLDKNRLTSVLFFLYQCRLFYNITGRQESAANIVLFFEQFCKSIEEVISDPAIYPAEFCDHLRDVTFLYKESVESIENTKNSKKVSATSALIYALFAKLGQRPRMRAFNALENFYNTFWQDAPSLEKGDNAAKIISLCNEYCCSLNLYKSSKDQTEDFYNLILQLIEILKLYATLEPFLRTDESLKALLKALNKTAKTNKNFHDKEDAIAVSLINGIIDNIRDDLTNVYEHNDEPNVIDTLAMRLNQVKICDDLDDDSDDSDPHSEDDLAPTIFFCRELKPIVVNHLPAPTLKERRNKPGYTS